MGDHQIFILKFGIQNQATLVSEPFRKAPLEVPGQTKSFLEF